MISLENLSDYHKYCCLTDLNNAYAQLPTQKGNIITRNYVEALTKVLHNNPFHKVLLVINTTTEPAHTEFIGCVTVIIEPKLIHNASIIAHIEDFVILPQHQGKGYGKEVLRLIETSLKTRYGDAFRKIVLYCSQHNTEFYRKSGFQSSSIFMSKYLE